MAVGAAELQRTSSRIDVPEPQRPSSYDLPSITLLNSISGAPTGTWASGLGTGQAEQEVWTDDYSSPAGTALRLPKIFWSISSPFRMAAMDDSRARDFVAT